MVFNKKMRYISLFIFMMALMSSIFFGFDQQGNIFKQRRKKLASMVEEGIIIIQSTENNQRNLYEFFVPNSDNHDFTYLTGLETANATLILCPGSEEYPEILYIQGDHEKIKKVMGIEHVYPSENLLADLSNAYTDFSLLRYTQRIWKSLPSEISRILYNRGKKKVIYFNFLRFVNLAEEPPQRFRFIHRIERFSPEYEIRDASDLLDRIRMYHDEFGLQQLRKAVNITGEAIVECMKSAKPGITEAQLRSIFRFVCDFKGTDRLGFHTTVRSGPRIAGQRSSRRMKVMKEGELIVIDCGAEVKHYTADIKRTFPVSGKFTEEQKRVYNILKRVQEACIKMVKPGITMKDLQEKALKLLDEEGGYGKYFGWGISHFLGMDVHDVGDNLIPFESCIVITVEPGIVLPEFRVELEDDVLCTKDGYEWLSEFIPREVEEIEEAMKEEGIGKIFR